MMNGFDSVDVHAFVSVAIVFLITNYWSCLQNQTDNLIYFFDNFKIYLEQH